MTRVAVYCRISRDRAGANVGVQRQQAECEDLATRNGWSVVATFIDNDLSAYSGKVRKDYRALLEFIRGGKCDAVLCWNTDRLHRSPSELEEYIDLCNPRSLFTFSVQAGELDLSTPSGRMVARQLGAVARYESELRSARVKSSKDQKAAQGLWSGGSRPFGYLNDGVTVDPNEALYINRATLDVLRGESLSSISRQWNADGITTVRGKRWTPGAVRDVLLRARNAGLRQHRGMIVGPGTWNGIVEPETWHAVRRLLTDPVRRISPGNQPKYLGAMRYRCGALLPDGTECGYPMKVTRSGPANFRIQVYVCSRTPKLGVNHVTIKREVIDEYVTHKLINGMLEQGSSSYDVDSVTVEPARMDEIDKAQEALAAELAAGKLPVSVWQAANAQLAERRAQYESQQASDVVSAVTASALGEFELDPYGTWEKMTLDQHRALLDAHVQVTVLPASSRSRWGEGVNQRVRLAWSWDQGE